MSWSKRFPERIGDILRFASYIFLAFDAIVLSVFLFWFVAKFLWRTAQWLDYRIFDSPWY